METRVSAFSLDVLADGRLPTTEEVVRSVRRPEEYPKLGEYLRQRPVIGQLIERVVRLERGFKTPLSSSLPAGLAFPSETMQAAFSLDPLSVTLTSKESAPSSGGPAELGRSLAEEAFVGADEDSQFAIVADDYRVAYRLLEIGALTPYRGQFIAVLKGQVVGAGTDPQELRKSVAQTCKAHPHRPAVIFIDGGTD
jgi:hypothetical protein